MSCCKTRIPQRLMPSNEKYIKFNKLQNCMLNNFVIYSDFECIIDKKIININLFQGDIWLNVEMINLQNKFKYLII